MRLTLITAALLAGLGSITAHSADTPHRPQSKEHP